MISEAPTIFQTEQLISVPTVFELSPLEQKTFDTAEGIFGLVERWTEEGDQMFTPFESKVDLYVNMRSLTRSIPRYANAIDVRDKNAIPNSQSGLLDSAFSKLHALWKEDPSVQLFLDQEKEDFELKYRAWYGTVGVSGERDRFLRQLTNEQQLMGHELSEREIDARELKARRAYFLPTITTASEFPV